MVSRVRNDVKLRRVGGDSCKTAWPPTLPTTESRKAGCLARKMDVEIHTKCWSHWRLIELCSPERWWTGSVMTLNYGGLVVTVVKLPGHQHCPRQIVVKLGAWPERWMLRFKPSVGLTEGWLNYADNHVRNDIKLASGSLWRQSSETVCNTVLRRWSEGWLNYACNHIQIWVFRQHCSACLC